MMSGWCEDKLAYIRSGLADLARRKNPDQQARLLQSAKRDIGLSLVRDALLRC
jgi:hypothetical protein